MRQTLQFKSSKRRLGRMNVDTAVVWLSYNAMPILDIARRSLLGFLEMDYDSYVLIFVDNASNDGSVERLLEDVKRVGHDDKLVFLRNDHNVGYTGGMNKGFQYVYHNLKGVKYIAFATNDVIPYPESLKEAVRALKSNERLVCVGGIIYYNDGRRIYAAGNWIDGSLRTAGICQFRERSECPTLDEEHPVTYVDGCYMVCNFEVLTRLFGASGPFLDEAFAYYDDSVLGIYLWNKGFEVRYIPIDFGIHMVSATFDRTHLKNFYAIRSKILLYYTLRSPNEWVKRIRLFKLELASYTSRLIRKAFDEAKALRQKAIEKYGILDLDKAPYLPLSLSNKLKYLLPYGVTIAKRLGLEKGPTHDDLLIPSSLSKAT